MAQCLQRGCTSIGFRHYGWIILLGLEGEVDCQKAPLVAKCNVPLGVIQVEQCPNVHGLLGVAGDEPLTWSELVVAGMTCRATEQGVPGRRHQ